MKLVVRALIVMVHHAVSILNLVVSLLAPSVHLL